ncbi:Shedu anti-phage system protein SduA domain-containing protein [Micromonospora sp. URMC 107]|uniref:Shedu anti-phage system protein SduA domain-containing protein n=1 Tax=Micromonospora sp. URMC 107 TaxID=3423418 RepID=UPI003F1B22BE
MRQEPSPTEGAPLLATSTQEALRDYWERSRGVDRYGERSLARDLSRAINQAFADDLSAAGIESSSIWPEAKGVPASYRTTPQRWDLVVAEDELPLALIEIQILAGSSFQVNVNNRLDSLVAAATNVARTFDGPDRAPYRPWVGVVFVLEENERNSVPLARRAERNPFTLTTDAQPASRIELVGSAFRRMLADRLVGGVCYLAFDTRNGQTREPFPDQTFESFVSSLKSYSDRAGEIRAEQGLSAAELGRVLSESGQVEEVMSGLTSTTAGLSAAESAVIRERRRIVAELQELASDPHSNERKMQAAMGKRYWLFGGQYIGVADRRTLVQLDQYDIPLICADGSLQVVELKGPESKLVRQHRNHLIVADQVHEAVSQCLNYLRSLDEMGAGYRTLYRNELGVDYDLRRARGLVVIGHPNRAHGSGISREQIDQAIRSYNAHLSRIQVVTYADLLDSAERALRFESERPNGAHGPESADEVTGQLNA